jgi:hypothetical protein
MRGGYRLSLGHKLSDAMNWTIVGSIAAVAAAGLTVWVLILTKRILVENRATRLSQERMEKASDAGVKVTPRELAVLRLFEKHRQLVRVPAKGATTYMLGAGGKTVDPRDSPGKALYGTVHDLKLRGFVDQIGNTDSIGLLEKGHAVLRSHEGQIGEDLELSFL